MDLRRLIGALFKWWWLIALSTLIAASTSYWGTTKMPRLYQTGTTLMVGRFIQSADPSSSDFWTSQQLAQSYVQLVRRQPVLQGVIDELGLAMEWPALAGMVNATALPNTQLLEISVVDIDPRRAAAIADEVARQLILQSPTTPDRDQAQQREFVNKQLQDLQVKMEDAKKQSDELEKRLALETSARAIQDTQSQISALQQKITTWQSNYANLLGFYKGSQTNYLSIVDPAVVPGAPFTPNVRYNVMLAALVGCLLAAGAAVLLEYIDDTVKTSEDVERLVKTPTLGVIARMQKITEPTDQLEVLHHPRSSITEAYRGLRTNVQFASIEDTAPCLLVTSATPGEGKSTTAANLAITLVQAGQRVILMDTDLRRPALHRLFGVSNSLGLTNLLLNRELTLEQALTETEIEGLWLLTSGPIPPNPAELLGSKTMQARLAQAHALADVIILDSPPVLAVADASILGRLSSGIIVVIDARRTRGKAVKQAKETLDRVNLKVVGVVLNKLRFPRHAYYYGNYAHYSQTGEKPSRRARNGATNGHVSPNGHVAVGTNGAVVDKPAEPGRKGKTEA